MSRYTLLPHQDVGATFLAERLVAMLFDAPGVGKSGQAIAAADRAGAKRVLILCPALVRPHWANTAEQQQEIERPVTVISSAKDVVPSTDRCVCVASHALLVQQKRVAELYRSGRFDAIIVDESAEFRTFDAQRTTNLLYDNALWTHTKHIWFLTGTPVVNSATDLYPVAYGPFRQIYGTAPTWFDFALKFSELRKDKEGNFKSVGIKNEEELAAIFRPFTLCRTLESAGIDLPPLSVQNVPVTIDKVSLSGILRDLSSWSPERVVALLEESEDIHDTDMARVRRALGIAKAEATVQHVLNCPRPSVVFFQHTDVRNLIGQRLTDAGLLVSYIDGTITRKQLTAAVDWFQDGRIDVLLVQIQAGGMGLTLTRSQQAVVAEQPWTAMALSQVIKRVHRITQTKPVNADVLQAQGCWLDDVMARVIQRKHIAAQKFLDLLT